MDDYQKFIHLSRYARWMEKEGRRETWEETVDRYFSFWDSKNIVPKKQLAELREAVVNMDIMPSMRCLMTAGEALARDNVAGYNCSYLAIDSPRAFDEAMYILLCGTGVGFSVERQYINKLPEIAEEFFDTDTVIIVADSKIGWAKAYKELISLLYTGQRPKWDVSKVRPAGARLKTFGGRASGPAPLVDLFSFTTEIFRRAAGRKLTSLECHDLMCKIADIVVVGGVRRSALISLSNLTDERMRTAKSGQWWVENPQRALANNSVCYTERPDIGIFMREWFNLYESKSGERGIFSRDASIKSMPARRKEAEYKDYGTNPCSEIILRSKQFCNLTEVVVRAVDTADSLANKVRLATILGTLQAMLTDLRYLRKDWRTNTEEEALLGVSLTGIMDHAVLSGSESVDTLPTVLQGLRQVALETNQIWSKKLGIKASAAITCVKPSGTVSQLVNSASGIHPRYSPFYIRTVRGDKKDPLSRFLIEQGVPTEDDFYNPQANYVFSFPVKAPAGVSVFRDGRSATQQLELWKLYAEHWCEHKPSITVYVKEHEWLEVGQWVWKHFDIISGVSFLPHSEHSYRQAPYQEITEAEYEALVAKMPKDIKWETMIENQDNTEGSQELACVAGQCEI